MGTLIFKNIVNIKDEYGGDPVQVWIDDLMDDEREQLRGALEALRAGSMDGLTHIHGKIYELSVRSRSVLLLYISIDLENSTLNLIKGLKIDFSQPEL